jgi:hypothetical protein
LKSCWLKIFTLNLGSKEKKDAYTKECFAPIQEKSKSGHVIKLHNNSAQMIKERTGLEQACIDFLFQVLQGW